MVKVMSAMSALPQTPLNSPFGVNGLIELSEAMVASHVDVHALSASTPLAKVSLSTNEFEHPIDLVFLLLLQPFSLLLRCPDLSVVVRLDLATLPSTKSRVVVRNELTQASAVSFRF